MQLETLDEEFPVYITYTNGSALEYPDLTPTRKKTTGEAVFCVEPGMQAGVDGELYRGEVMDRQQLSGYSDILDGRLTEDIYMTPEARHHLALYVYHGREALKRNEAAARVAIQCYVWQYLWPISEIEFLDPAQGESIRKIQKEILRNFENHYKLPNLRGPGYDEESGTLRIKAGETVTLKDLNDVSSEAREIFNNTNIEVQVRGDEIRFTADRNASSGEIHFQKFKDIDREASSFLYTFGSKQKIGEFKAADPVLFELTVDVEKFGEILFTKRDEAGNFPDGGIFELRDETGTAVKLKEIRAGEYTADEDGAARFTTKEGRALLQELPAGNYTVHEIKAPPNYLKTKEPASVQVRPQERSRAELSNEAMTAPLRIQKYNALESADGSGEAELAGAQYALIAVSLTNPQAAPYKEGDIAARLTTDENGCAESEPLHLGTYDLTETEAGTGYLKNETAVRLAVLSDGEKAYIEQISYNAAPLLALYNAKNEELNQLLETEKAARGPLPPAAEIVPETEADVITAESLIYGRFELNKVFRRHNDASGTLKEAEEGIEFSVKDSLGRECDRLVTNADGRAYSRWLPYGTYTVEQLTEQSHAYPAQPFSVTIDKPWSSELYQLQNEEVTARLRIVKKDAESGRLITQAGVIFELYREDGTQVVQHTYYPQEQEIRQFITAEDGSVTLPEVLPAGNYILKEVKGPEGYVLPLEGKDMAFTVSRETASAAGLILTLEAENQRACGQILIDKQGPVLQSWQSETLEYEVLKAVPAESFETEEAEAAAEPFEDQISEEETSDAEEDGENFPGGSPEEEPSGGETAEDTVYEKERRSIDVYSPVFVNTYIAGAVFEIRAAEDIAHADGELMFKAGELVETLVTDGAGPVSSGKLPLGLYEVEEVKAPEAYVRDKEIYPIRLSREEASQALVQESLNAENVLQKAEISVEKSFETSDCFGEYKEAAAQTLLGIFTKEELRSGDISLPAGSCLGLASPDEDMRVRFTGLLPFEHYLIRELAAAPMYEMSEKEIEASFTADEENEPLSRIETASSIHNELKEFSVVLLKTDAEDNKLRLPGASFKLVAVREEGELELGEYMTDAEGVLRIDHLHAGSYYLQEVSAPAGYYLSSGKIPIKADGSRLISKAESVNKKTSVYLNKTDAETAEGLAGALLELLDEDGNLLLRWESDGGKKQLEGILEAGKSYILREREAPAGYLKAADLRFSLPFETDGSYQIAALENHKTRTEIRKTDVGGNEIPGAKLEISDAEGKIIESWISEAGKVHVVRGLKLGETYTLRETLAPEGYIKAEEIQFTLNEDGSVTKIEMINERMPEIVKTGAGRQTSGPAGLLFLAAASAAAGGRRRYKRKSMS